MLGTTWRQLDNYRNLMDIRKKIDCFLPCNDLKRAATIAEQFQHNDTVNQIYLLVSGKATTSKGLPEGVSTIMVDNLLSADTMRAIAEATTADYALFYMKSTPVTLGYQAIDRFMQVASALMPCWCMPITIRWRADRR